MRTFQQFLESYNDVSNLTHHFLENPLDNTTRMVLSDALEESGDEEGTEFFVAMIQSSAFNIS